VPACGHCKGSPGRADYLVERRACDTCDDREIVSNACWLGPVWAPGWWRTQSFTLPNRSRLDVGFCSDCTAGCLRSFNDVGIPIFGLSFGVFNWGVVDW
jgi:hypothetical protein